MTSKRGFGEIERRRRKGGGFTYRARYMTVDGARHSRTLATKLDAETWLAAERRLLDRDEWTPPSSRRAAREAAAQAAAANTVASYAERYLSDPDRALRPSTVRGYRHVLNTRVLPAFGDTPLGAVTLAAVKAWRASMNPSTPAANAAAYRLLRSLLQAAEADELIDRAPPQVRGAANARSHRAPKPATLDEIATIVDHMPERLRLFVVLAAFVGLREGELLELRRADVDGVTGRISVTRKVEKDVDRMAPGACRNCGRVVGAPKTASGVRTIHLPPPFLPALQRHLLEHTAAGPLGLLFPGDRKDHMSVRYLMDRYRPAREAADRPDLTIHHLRHTALTLAGQHGATAAELQARGGHSSQITMAIYQHGTIDRDQLLAAAIGDTYNAWLRQRET